MYYLNEEHPEYEYVVYCRVSNACPYLSYTFSSIRQIKQFIDNIEKKHNRFNHIFYIDNDFYKNHYSINMNGYYYKILRRKVNDWEDFTIDEKEILKCA